MKYKFLKKIAFILSVLSIFSFVNVSAMYSGNPYCAPNYPWEPGEKEACNKAAKAGIASGIAGAGVGATTGGPYGALVGGTNGFVTGYGSSMISQGMDKADPNNNCVIV